MDTSKSNPRSQLNGQLLKYTNVVKGNLLFELQYSDTGYRCL